MHTFERPFFSRPGHPGSLALLSFATALLIAPPGALGGDEPPSQAVEVLTRTSVAFNDIAQKATPAVVSISVVKSPNARDAAAGPGAFPHDFGIPDGDSRSYGIGSGLFVRPDGYILTNHHVIEDAEKVTVTLDEKHRVQAEVIGSDPKTDLAVIRLKGNRKDFPILNFGDSAEIKVGDWAIAIGSPFGLNRSVSSGIISAKGRAQMGILDTEDFIQTDAAINPGSSGGPLLNLRGDVIGINTAIFSQGSGFVGIGFAIPAKIAKEVSEQLIAHGRVLRGWVGVSAQDLDEDLAKFFQTAGSEGALISDVTPGGPAAKASLRAGDVIRKFDGEKITGATNLKSKVSETKSGSDVAIEVLRDGAVRQLKLHVAQQPVERKQLSQQAGRVAGKKSVARRGWGLMVEDIPMELAALLGFKNAETPTGALIVGVEPGSPAFEAGLSPGDVILRLDRTEVPDAKSFTALAKKRPHDSVSMLYVKRGPQEKIFVALKPVT
ncbi:MAG: trypsin-like peptidase domain-containing protein [Oligoflexia bacterium]|nr:trypsin-like peptidase domain-containing protein [Oligoflexia bacterium]